MEAEMKPNQTEDDDRIAKDGEVVRVPMMMMTDSSVPRATAASQITDGAQHRPGFAAINDADITTRQTAYDAYQKRLTSAYKDPPPLAEVNAIATVKPSAGNDFYQTYDSTVSERWRAA
jgi:hypothetical protein